MEQGLKESWLMARRVVKAASSGVMDPATRGSLPTMKCMVRALTDGQMDGYMRESGQQALCTVMGTHHGQMAEPIMANTRMA